MAERVAKQTAADAGLDAGQFASAGVSAEETGAPMDPRAAQVLKRHGYQVGKHAAHRITGDELAAADLVVAMEQHHIDLLRRLGDVSHVRLLTDFDPDAEPGTEVPDPWYGTPEAFEETLTAIEAAIPGVLEAINKQQ